MCSPYIILVVKNADKYLQFDVKTRETRERKDGEKIWTLLLASDWSTEPMGRLELGTIVRQDPRWHTPNSSPSLFLCTFSLFYMPLLYVSVGYTECMYVEPESSFVYSTIVYLYLIIYSPYMYCIAKAV